MKNFLRFIVVLTVGLYACFPDDEMPRGFQDFEVDRLLASDSSKIWERFSRTENGFEFASDSCNLDDIIIFEQETKVATSIVLDSTCTDSIIFEGIWEVLQGESSFDADSMEVIYLKDQLVLDTIYDENDSTLITRIDTSTVKVEDTLIWVIDEITSQILTYSFQDTLLFPFYIEDEDTSIFFLDTIPLDITEKYRFRP